MCSEPLIASKYLRYWSERPDVAMCAAYFLDSVCSFVVSFSSSSNRLSASMYMASFVISPYDQSAFILLHPVGEMRLRYHIELLLEHLWRL